MNEITASAGPPADGQGIAEYYGWSPSPAADETAKRVLSAEFPEWSIIQTTDTNRWWAVLRPSERGGRPDDAVTEVDANTPEGLRNRLREAEA
ncbi:hypothetical protein ACQP1W_01005 [Spirillospora sp. CA-255316]